ncbi:PH domain-containing protein [Trujillonella endophytica]|uniref:Putative membrane protein n=1 Tax=Trujillonella endophytica TaxID=673521 RepID=A0A1H8WKX7_9ACTN|nr:PH domain-containing protein [Trujillella endophytica]SEP28183.1 putative membrane protein [Trujillella endophytica]
MSGPALAAAPRRTSARIVLVHTVTFRQARQVLGIALPVGAAIGFDGGATAVALLAVAATLASLAFAAVSWWRFTYTDGPASVVVTRGLLARSTRTVPRDRIRGVEVEQPLLHRLLGMVRVRIDAAAGAATGEDEEVVLDGVGRAEGDRLRAGLLVRRSAAGPTPEPPAPPAEEVLARFDRRWLLYAPLVGGYLAVPLAALGALLRLVDEIPRGLRPEVDGPEVTGPAGAAVAIAVAAVLLALGSVVGAALVNWGFRLVRRGGSLVAVRGLVTRRHTELEVDRVRGVTVAAGLGMRWVRAARVNALVTGLGAAQRRGQLLPLGPRVLAEELAARLVDDPGPLRRHPPAARRRRLARAVAPGLAVAGAGAVAAVLAGGPAGWWPLFVAGLVLAGLGVPVALGRYAALGHAAGPRSFAVRSGWLVQERAVLQRRAVVGWRVRQSPFQRRAGLATVVACVGAGSGGYAAVDVAAADVVPFARAASGAWAGALEPERLSGGRPSPPRSR